ncbi:MAG TPA: amidohydrolase family protein, partial [Bacillota bacterium]|nr:amidohydrolase family protein [Bacillota bacterium]
PLVDAVKMVTLTPAKLLGIDHCKGVIAPGKDADLVVFDAHINVSLVMVGGQVRFDKDQEKNW